MYFKEFPNSKTQKKKKNQDINLYETIIVTEVANDPYTAEKEE